MRSRQARKPCDPRSCSASRRWLGAAPKSPFLARVDARQAKLRKSRAETTEGRRSLSRCAGGPAPHRSHIVRFTSIPRTKPIHAMQHAHTHTHTHTSRATHADTGSTPTCVKAAVPVARTSPPNHSCQITLLPTVWAGPLCGFSPAGSGAALAVTTTPMGVETDAAPPGSAASSLAACSPSSHVSLSRFRS